MRYPRLTINHNHGALRLADATVGADGAVRGTIISGSVTSRLFHATSTRHETPGAPATWPLYGREPRQTYLGWSEDGRWMETPVPGEYEVDCTFCG